MHMWSPETSFYLIIVSSEMGTLIHRVLHCLLIPRFHIFYFGERTRGVIINRSELLERNIDLVGMRSARLLLSKWGRGGWFNKR